MPSSERRCSLTSTWTGGDMPRQTLDQQRLSPPSHTFLNDLSNRFMFSPYKLWMTSPTVSFTYLQLWDVIWERWLSTIYMTQRREHSRQSVTEFGICAIVDVYELGKPVSLSVTFPTLSPNTTVDCSKTIVPLLSVRMFSAGVFCSNEQSVPVNLHGWKHRTSHFCRQYRCDGYKDRSKLWQQQEVCADSHILHALHVSLFAHVGWLEDNLAVKPCNNHDTSDLHLPWWTT